MVLAFVKFCWRVVIKEKKLQMEENKAAVRERTKTYFNQTLKEMNQKVSRRKMLFEQATQDNLRRQVLEKFDEVRRQNFVVVERTPVPHVA